MPSPTTSVAPGWTASSVSSQSIIAGYLTLPASGTTTGSPITGIFAGCEYLSTANGKMVSSAFWPGADVASTAQSTIVAKIIPCTGAVASTFLVQSDATGVAFAGIGQNIDVALGTGNTSSGQSGAYLDVSTINTTATLPFRVISLLQGPSLNGTDAGAYNIAVVAFNSVATKQLTGV